MFYSERFQTLLEISVSEIHDLFLEYVTNAITLDDGCLVQDSNPACLGNNTMNNPFKHLFHPTAVDFLAFVRCCHDYLRLGCLFSLVKTHFMYHQGVKKQFCKGAFV